MFIGQATVGSTIENLQLYVEGAVPILRERDLVTPEQADTPATRLCLLLQQAYLAGKVAELHSVYLVLANDIMRAAPSLVQHLTEIASFLEAGEPFKAIKASQKLIEAERALLSPGRSSMSSREQ